MGAALYTKQNISSQVIHSVIVDHSHKSFVIVVTPPSGRAEEESCDVSICVEISQWATIYTSNRAILHGNPAHLTSSSSGRWQNGQVDG
ncbi:hypothetical protein AVEN_106760-1 [Araneus ventricosus]|uniref:Uncharacterized protein n=1 Tax=Araneus ventricosus TaxID=182803 RepID=A0A4Y2F2B0_ARAVE|nr:hypothetical protein AVEN_106760-1 [Araneus ventricosus]